MFFVFGHDRFRTISMRIATSEVGEEVGEDNNDARNDDVYGPGLGIQDGDLEAPLLCALGPDTLVGM
jgi:hypothetical protein